MQAFCTEFITHKISWAYHGPDREAHDYISINCTNMCDLELFYSGLTLCMIMQLHRAAGLVSCSAK